MTSTDRMILLVDGFANPITAKTSVALLRYRPEDVAAVLDTTAAGKTSQELLGQGGAIPVVGSLAEVPDARTLVIGIAPPGGKIPAPWRKIILEAIGRGMRVISGMHEMLKDDAEFARAAREKGVELIDLRETDFHEVATGDGFRPGCLRIATIAPDCSCGKMIAAVEVTRGLQQRGLDAEFVATGQTGMLIAGGGMAVDRVICDFLAGAAERLVQDRQQHDILLIEGQGSLFHPRYSAVTLGLLHGSRPDGLILCYEMGRKTVGGMPNVPLPSLARVRDYYEMTGGILHPCRAIGVAVSGRNFDDLQVREECDRVEAELGLPACDLFRHGPEKLVEAVIELQREFMERR